MEYITAKTILSSYKADNSWFGGHYNMNIYKGCSHGCIYCDSRSDCYHVENFDQVRAKENALLILEQELKTKRKSGVIGMGAMSDPYNPFEKSLELTRGSLKLIEKYRFGAGIATKSDLIARDADVLKQIAIHAPVIAKITITAADDTLCQKIEPHVSPSSKRFEALKVLADTGIYAGVLLMPVLPFIEDSEENIVAIVQKAHENGARFIYPGFGVTLRMNQREWFYDKLDELFPKMKEKYIREFGDAYSCGSPNVKALKSVFEAECDRRGITYRMKDIIAGYQGGYENKQLSLFD